MCWDVLHGQGFASVVLLLAELSWVGRGVSWSGQALRTTLVATSGPSAAGCNDCGVVEVQTLSLRVDRESPVLRDLMPEVSNQTLY